MSVSAIRVSKTSLKNWVLHGPIDQALKTTIQASAVRVVPIHNPDGSAELELWVSADDHGQCLRHVNFPVMAIIARSDARRRGEVPPVVSSYEDEDFLAYFQVLIPEGMEPVFGPAVLTGPGGTDVPDFETTDLMETLLGI